ncbi:NAD-dependent epimerase/dehydratase family protein [Paraburkholderia sediminicola]|uniref:NAD-dependent epimerase/dehydratase family protein n=1 Tax=Paraburkholderia sediminicola TaxID=458836 RepID=UPI0038BC9272
MASSCLVTGGAGFIGCALSQHLSLQFDRVVILDSLHPQIHASRARPISLDAKCELIEGDVTDAAVWEKLLDGFTPDVVIHLAAETGTGQSLSEATRHAHTNVVGTTVMLDAFLRRKAIPERIVLTSSRATYGEGAWTSSSGRQFYPGQRSVQQLTEARWDFDGKPVAMDASKVKPAPVSVYGATKLAQEHILSSWANSVGCEYVVLRLQNVFGPGQSLINSYTGIVSLFCQLARRKESIPLYEDGLVQRDFILIDDIVSAIMQGVRKDGVSGEVFDIGSGVATTLIELGNAIAEIYGAPAPHVVGKFRFGDVRHAFCDSSRAQAKLDWQPKFSLQAGLLELTKWIEAQH